MEYVTYKNRQFNVKNYQLDLSNKGISKISDISNLDNLKTVRTLFLQNNVLDNIDGLEQLTSLKTLYLFNNKISEINGLGTLENLEDLNISNNEIKAISGLIKKRNDYVANFFRKIFTKGIDEVVQEIFPNPTNLELYNLALDTIRHNYDSRYSAAQLCIDLNFATMFGISENTLRTQGSHYIEEKIGVSFTDLKFQALNVPKRNYFALAVDLLRAHIDKIGSNRHLYNMGKLAVDLGLHQDFGFPIDSLRSNANRFLMTYTGYTWVDLIKFAQSNIVI